MRMTAKRFYDWQTVGGTDDVMRLVDCLERADIVNWIQAGTLSNVYGTSQFTDGDATNQPRRFYRAALLNP